MLGGFTDLFGVQSQQIGNRGDNRFLYESQCWAEMGYLTSYFIVDFQHVICQWTHDRS